MPRNCRCNGHEPRDLTLPRSFISPEDARERASHKQRDIHGEFEIDWWNVAVAQYKKSFPDIVYKLDATDLAPNGFAGGGTGGEPRWVKLTGGFIRQLTISYEGIVLALAHELGHHFGGVPQSADHLACEGQADYYGVGTVMRTAWPAGAYTANATEGIRQVAAFFGVSSKPIAAPPNEHAGCDHPTYVCRIATFQAAVAGGKKPDCAC